ncbi:MAG TPA: hypothetical protein VF734_13565 [Pseudonocardiaceae bacterium]
MGNVARVADRAEVDHHAAVADRGARGVVEATAHRDPGPRWRANSMAAATSAALRQRAITAGYRFASPFHAERASW